MYKVITKTKHTVDKFSEIEIYRRFIDKRPSLCLADDCIEAASMQIYKE